MDAATALIPARNAAAEGKLLVFAGAGISMLPPSYLPDWKGFNAALLESIKRSALALPGLADDAGAGIRRLDIDAVPVEAFSDSIVHSLAGNDYFPLLRILDSDQPNGNHRAIAELSRRGACPAIVTTNFDRLLERSFPAGVLEVFSAPDEFRRRPQKRCALYKVHGSVDDASTLVDTVGQKLRGLAFPVRARLTELFSEYHVLVLGFSGADLDFGSDYLALSTLKTSRRGVTWVVQPGRSLRPRVQELIRDAAGTPVESDLADVFPALGVTFPAFVPPSSAEATQREVDKRTSARVAEWLNGLGGGSFYSLLFCTVLAEELGWALESARLRRAVAAELSRCGDTLPITAIPAFNLLASTAEDQGDFAASSHWAEQALGLLALFDERRQAVAEPVNPAGLQQIEQQRFSAWLQLGRSRAAGGNFSGARQAFAQAQEVADQLQDDQKRSSLFANEGILLRRENASAEKQLPVFRRAWSLAARSGSAQVMTEAGVNEAFTLLGIGEYDLAIATAARAETVARFSGNFLARLGPNMIRAEIAARRGRAEEAFAESDRMIAAAASDPIAQARLRRAAAAMIAYLPGGRERSIRYLTEVLEAMAAGQIPGDGSCAYLQSQEIRKLRDAVMTITPSERPRFLDPPGSAEPGEREMRTVLVRAEYEGNARNVAAALGNLANERYDAARPKRQLDLADAALAAAERAGEREMKFGALLLLTTARDLSGYFQGAIDAGQQILQADPPVREELRVRAMQNLAVVLTRIGRSTEAVPLLRTAQEIFSRIGPKESQARCAIALASALAAGGDRSGGLDVLDKARDVVDSTGDQRAMAKRSAILASLTCDGGPPGPPPLFSDASGPAAFLDSQAAPEEQIERLRRSSESAQETCEVAALAIRSGFARTAVRMLLEAQAYFHSNNDEEGLIRCFHLLGDAAQVEGRWDEAADLTRYALNLEQNLSDFPGLIASHAALALQFLQVGEMRGAKWAAGESLSRAAGGGPSRFTACAKYAMAEAHRRSGDGLHSEATRLVLAEIRAASDLAPGSQLRAWLEERVNQWSRSGKLGIASLWKKLSHFRRSGT